MLFNGFRQRSLVIVDKHPNRHRNYDYITHKREDIGHLMAEEKIPFYRRKNNVSIVINGDFTARCIRIGCRNSKLSARGTEPDEEEINKLLLRIE